VAEPRERDATVIHPHPIAEPLVAERVDEVSTGDLDDAAAQLLREATDTATRNELAREGLRRASRLAADLDLSDQRRRPPMRPHYPRWGWRRAVRFAVERRMLGSDYLMLYRRWLAHRAAAALRGEAVVFHGMVFAGKRVELHARRDHGRLVLGPWCWIGDDNKLRAHEGQLTLGEKVVMGRDNVVNAYLDIEIGDASILADWIYVCDFDHNFDRLDVPIKDQGISTAPVRIGPDTWIGEKATVLRGVDVGRGSVVGSHCLVNVDVPPFSIVVGVPARVVRSRLPTGMDPEEAADLLRRGQAIPGDPIG
jgi:acetyltransferase-like isoleucine patch superfamily enzyme